MKKLITVFFSLAISITLNALPENFESYPAGQHNNGDVFNLVFGDAYADAYVMDDQGVDGTNGFLFATSWSKGTDGGTFLGALKNLDNVNLTNASISLDTKYLNHFTTEVTAETSADTELKIMITGANEDIWETGKQTITSDYSTLTFSLTDNMTKIDNSSGGEVLAEALENVINYRLIFSNDAADTLTHQHLYIDNISLVPEPSAYALLAGLLSLGWISIKRRIR